MQQYCTQCGLSVMPTMRLCPACGSRSFQQDKPTNSAANLPKPQTKSQSASTSPSSSPSISQKSTTLLARNIQQAFTPSGHLRRIVAYLIDYLIIMVGATVLGSLAGLAGIASTSPQAIFSGAILLLVGAILPFIYFTILHSRPSGATWGKAAMRIRVVTQAGEPLSVALAFMRCFLTLLVPVAGWIVVGLTAAGTMTSEFESIKGIGLVAAGLGVIAVIFGPYITVFFNAQRQTVFDLFCKTCVIKAR